MALEEILERHFEHPEQTLAQARAIWAVKRNPEYFLSQYIKHPDSFNGRYICTDLFKELFSDYNKSKEARGFFNSAVHNSAAVLASEQFRRVLAKKPSIGRDTVIFLTGIPGAGKTSAIMSSHESLPPSYHAIYEGQLYNPKTTIPKLEQALDAGFCPEIRVVHVKPEFALDNTIKRFNALGRGASINIMSTIQGGLSDGLLEVKKTLGAYVKLTIFDNRDRNNPRTYNGWQELDILRSEGSQVEIKKVLMDRIERYHEAGTISESCYRQAIGLSTKEVEKNATKSKRDREYGD